MDVMCCCWAPPSGFCPISLNSSWFLHECLNRVFCLSRSLFVIKMKEQLTSLMSLSKDNGAKWRCSKILISGVNSRWRSRLHPTTQTKVAPNLNHNSSVTMTTRQLLFYWTVVFNGNFKIISSYRQIHFLDMFLPSCCRSLIQSKQRKEFSCS